MPQVILDGKIKELDEHFRLINPNDWSANMANYIASKYDIKLESLHLNVVFHARNYFKAFGRIKAMDFWKSIHRHGEEYSFKNIKKLFPGEKVLETICAIAGVPINTKKR